MIKVYHFRLRDQGRGDYVVPPYKSPAELISFLGGVILPETGESVDVSSLDNEQRYDPRAWRKQRSA